MKRFLLALVLSLCPGVVFADVTVTVGSVSKSTTVAQDNAVLALVANLNATNCRAVGLAVGCTQSAYNAASGAQPGVTIYAGTGTGAMQYVLDQVFANINAIPAQTQAISLDAARVAFVSATPSQQGDACVALGKDRTTCK